MTTQIAEKKKSGGIRDLGKMFGGGQSTGRQFGILGALVVIIVLFTIFQRWVLRERKVSKRRMRSYEAAVIASTPPSTSSGSAAKGGLR